MADNETGGFIWYELLTDDAARAKAFYDGVVGWDIDGANSVPGGGMDYRMIKRSDGGFAGGMMVMTPEMAAGGARPGWLAYVHVADVDAAVSAFEKAGGTVHMPAMDMDGVGRMAMLADPWGATLYVMTPTPPEGNPDAKSDVFSVDQPQRIRWNELSSSDPDAAAKFYGELFGWTQQGSMPMGEMGDYLFIQHDGVGIGAIMPTMLEGGGPRWNLYIGVDDIDRAMAAVSAGGGTVVNGPHEIPGGEFSLHGVDPMGGSFGLVGPRRSAG